MKKIILFIVLTFILVISISAIEDRAANILIHIDRRLGFVSYTATAKVINYEPNGLKKEFVMKIYKKDTHKVAILFLSPATDRGRTTLRLGENMWMFIKSAGRPIRIAALQSVIGGVFNNSDLMRLEYHVEYNPKIKRENQNLIELELKAKTAYVAYDKLMMIVDKRYMTPISIGCYSASGIMIKVLNFKNMKNFGNGLIRPSVIETTSPLQKGYRSVWILGDITPTSLRDELFTLNYMPILGDRGY